MRTELTLEKVKSLKERIKGVELSEYYYWCNYVKTLTDNEDLLKTLYTIQKENWRDSFLKSAIGKEWIKKYPDIKPAVFAYFTFPSSKRIEFADNHQIKFDLLDYILKILKLVEATLELERIALEKIGKWTISFKHIYIRLPIYSYLCLEIEINTRKINIRKDSIFISMLDTTTLSPEVADKLLEDIVKDFTENSEFNINDIGINLVTNSIFIVKEVHSDHIEVDFITGGNISNIIWFNEKARPCNLSRLAN